VYTKENNHLHSQIITTLNIHDNNSHNAYKKEFIAVAFTKRSGTDKRTNKHMDGQMNKKKLTHGQTNKPKLTALIR
jgi:hypothetical protein